MQGKVGKSRKKVLFVTPPYHCGVLEAAGRWLPLGFVYIAGALREAGFEPVIYDAMTKFHDFEDVARRIETEKPWVVVTTCYTSTYSAGKRLLEIAKQILPSIITVMGGVHPTFMWKEVLEECPAVDFIVRYEGELSLPELLLALEENGNLSKVRGVAYRRDGKPVANPLIPYIENLDNLTKAWDLLEWEDYLYFAADNKRLAILDTSRGCPFGCTFCSQQLFWEKDWRVRSPEKVVVEIEELHSRYGVEVFMFSDELPTWDRKRWEQLLDLLIEKDLGIEILMESRVDDILRDEDIMEKYKKAGISHIYVGLESVSQKTLDFFKKNIKVAQSKKVVDLINEYDIISETSFVLGMPDDTHSSIQKTLDLAKHYNADMTFFLAISPWPYSEIYPELEPYIVDRDYSHYNLITPVIKPKAMKIEEVQNELDRCHMEFYMTKMKLLGSMSAFKRKYMRDVFKILRDSCIGELIKKISLPKAMKTALRA